MLSVITTENSIYFVINFVGSDTYASKISQIAYFIFMIIVDHRISFYFLHLDVIVDKLREIETNLKKLKKIGTKFNIFREIHNNYGHIHKMSDLMNDIFGLSNIALILYSYQSLLTLLNCVYYRDFNEMFHKSKAL